MSDKIGVPAGRRVTEAGLAPLRVQDLVALAPSLAVLVTDADGIVRWANEVLAGLLRQPVERLVDRPLAAFVRSSTDAAMTPFRSFVAAARDGLTLTLRPPCADDDLVLMRAVMGADDLVTWSVEPLSVPGSSSHQPAGRPDLLLSVAEEISDFGCFRWDMSNDVLAWSDGLMRIFGLERSNFSNRGAAFFEQIHPEDRETVREAMAEASRNGGQFRNTERIVRPNGEVRWLESLGRMSFDSAGAPKQLVGVCRDITDIVQNANELRRQIDDRNLLESQLLQAQKVEAIGRMTSGIAHDFNNLLTVIASGCELLKLLPGDALRPDGRELVQAIEDAGLRASQLTDQLLLYSRASTRRPRAIDLNVALEESRQFLARVLGTGNELSITLSELAPVARIDPTHLQQILLNLVVNGRDAMPEGGQLSIRVGRAERAPQPPSDLAAAAIGYVTLVVTDSGIGMAPDVQAKIFDPFFTTKPAGLGTGLGLSVVDGIVRAAGGFIELDSAAGRGTEFRIYLPAVDGASEPLAASVSDELAQGMQRILVVEDEPAVLKVVMRSFEEAGYLVIGTSDPAEAVRLSASLAQPIDLLVTDVSMPTLSGPELVRSIQGDSPSLPFPVLFLSGNDQQVLEHMHGIQASAVNFIRKPFRMSALIRKTQDLLQERA